MSLIGTLESSNRSQEKSKGDRLEIANKEMYNRKSHDSRDSHYKN